MLDRSKLLWTSVVTFSSRQWLRCLLLVALAVGVRLPAIQGPFLWDDLYLAHDNPFIKSPLLILESFRHYLFPDSFSGHYRPVQTISYFIDYLIWNTDAYGYHLSNILVHAASGLLLFVLLQRLLPSLFRSHLGEDSGNPRNQDHANISTLAFTIALLWVIHPVHSAAIDYISGRADSLAFLFACSGWLLFIRARELPGPVRRTVFCFLAASSALLALCARESGCMWLVVFLIYTLCFERTLDLRAKALILAVCLSIAGIYAGLRQLPESRPADIVTVSEGATTRAVLMLRALGDYGRLMVFPSNLHMERSVAESASLASHESWRNFIRIEYLSLAGSVLLVIFSAGCSCKGSGRRARVFGAIWFLVTYLPTSNLFPLSATVAEHWLYLPSVGFLIFVAGIVTDVPVRFRPVTIAVGALAVAGFASASLARSSDWVDEETFFRSTYLAGGTSCRVDVNLARLYAKRGEYVAAEKILQKLLQTYPDYPVARNNLADVRFRQGKTKEAEAILEVASKAAPKDRFEFPRTWTAALSLARLRHNEKDDQTALAIMAQARTDYPGIWQLISFEAELLREKQGPQAALPLVQDFAREHRWHFGASIALGRIFSEMGAISKAEAAFRHASWLDIHDSEALNLLALLNVQQNKLEEAWKAQRRAVARQPDQPQQYLLLSDILSKMGRNEEARHALAEVTRLKSVASSLRAEN